MVTQPGVLFCLVHRFPKLLVAQTCRNYKPLTFYCPHSAIHLTFIINSKSLPNSAFWKCKILLAVIYLFHLIRKCQPLITWTKVLFLFFAAVISYENQVSTSITFKWFCENFKTFADYYIHKYLESVIFSGGCYWFTFGEVKICLHDTNSIEFVSLMASPMP